MVDGDHRRSGGFTIVELLVSIALMIILVGVVAFIFIRSQRVYHTTIDRVQSFRNLRLFNERLESDLGHLIINQDPERRFTIERQLYDRTEVATYRSDILSFAIRKVVHGEEQDLRVTYKLVSTQPDTMIPLLVREVEELDSGEIQQQILVEGALSFHVRYLYYTEEGVSTFKDPGSLTENGSLFYVSGTDGRIRANRFTTDRAARFWAGSVPGTEIFLGRPGEELYPYPIQGTQDGPLGEPEATVLLENPQPESNDVEYSYYNLPAALQITVRLMPFREGRLGPSEAADGLTRIVDVPR